MDNPIFQKAVVILVLIVWVINALKINKKRRFDPAIEEANARERHEWRYLRWGFRAIQAVAAVYIFVQLIQFVLR